MTDNEVLGSRKRRDVAKEEKKEYLQKQNVFICISDLF